MAGNRTRGREASAIQRRVSPIPGLIEAKKSFQSEDVGGPWGYAEFLEAIIDPGRERHAELTEWYGAHLRQSIERDALDSELAKLAQHRTASQPAAAAEVMSA